MMQKHVSGAGGGGGGGGGEQCCGPLKRKEISPGWGTRSYKSYRYVPPQKGMVFAPF